MKTTILTAAATTAILMLLPAGALASPIPVEFERLDADISHAWDAGKLTRAELDEVRNLQNSADRVIADARRDGVITPGENERIRNATNRAVLTFRNYERNRAVRSVRVAARPAVPRPVAVVKPIKVRPIGKIVIRPPRIRVVIR